MKLLHYTAAALLVSLFTWQSVQAAPQSSTTARAITAVVPQVRTIDNKAEEEERLSRIAQDNEQSIELRIQAVVALGQYSGPNAFISIARASRAKQPELRLAAIEAVRFWSVKARWDVVSPLVNDSHERVQIAAGNVLVSLWGELNVNQQAYLQPAVDQYVAALKKIPTDFQSQLALANVYRYQQQTEQAELAYKALIKLFPLEGESYLQLGELYRKDSAKVQEVMILKQGILVNPQAGNLHYALGLTYYRQKDSEQAQRQIQLAIDNEPSNGRYPYTLGVMIKAAEPVQAIKLFQQAYDNTGAPQYLYALCESYIEQGHEMQARQCIGKLKQLAPDNIVKQLTDKL
jgi:tetratricopeptide (TPR) repeat protein